MPTIDLFVFPLIPRFATEPYTNDLFYLNNHFIHMPNYSLNKILDNSVHSEDPFLLLQQTTVQSSILFLS